MASAIRIWTLLSLAALLLSCGAKVRPLQGGKSEPQEPVQVLVVPIRGALGTQELALSQRALREAARQGMQVVFHFESAGSSTDSFADVQALLDRLAEVRPRVATTALVQGQVQGGAAYLAILCDQLYFLRGGQIATIAPVASTWEEIRALTDESAERQRLRAYAADVLRRLEQRKVKLRADALRRCEGLADPGLRLLQVTVRERGLETTRIVSSEELTALQGSSATVLAQAEVPQTISAAEADELGISRGVVDSIEQLCSEVLLVDRRLVGELTFSWAEQMVGWLELLQPALLVLGFVLLLLELKTPGVGLPGALGVLFLGLAMFYSYLVGLAEVTEILLFFLGLAAIGVEIFVLPGTIVFGAVGFLAVVFALILSRQSFVLPQTVTQEEVLLQNLWDLTLLFVLVVAGAMLLWKVLPHIPLLRSVLLPPPPPAAATGASTQFTAPLPLPLVGRRGRADTVLRPAGVVEIDGVPYDVVTRGDFIEAGTQVQVVAVEGNRVVVERVAAAPGQRDGERGSVGLVLMIAVIGLALLVAEVVFVSFGILSVLSGLALVSAVFLAFQESTAFGTWVLIGEAVAAPVVLALAFRILPRTRLGRALLLEGPPPDAVRAAAEEPNLQRFRDRSGIAQSPLRPAGIARIDGERVDVVTRGEMIEADEAIRVVEVSGNRVVVARERKPAGAP